MIICDWFNSSALMIQNYISSPFDFYDNNIPCNYKNVLSSFKKSINNFKLELFNEPFVNNDDLISSHKYSINFNDEQHEILKNYFEECEKVYNLCVDIWNDYKECTSNWQIFKDVLFQYLYRNDKTNYLPIDQIKNLIILNSN